MRPREARGKVALKARLPLNGTWEDACIRDISSRGLCIQSTSPPRKGSHIKIYRGAYTIIARVVWAQDDRFGVYSRHRIDVDAVVREPSLSGSDYKTAVAANPLFDRRRSLRPDAAEIARKEDRKRLALRAMELLGICALGTSGAMLMFTAAQDVATDPLAAVSQHFQRP